MLFDTNIVDTTSQSITSNLNAHNDRQSARGKCLMISKTRGAPDTISTFDPYVARADLMTVWSTSSENNAADRFRHQRIAAVGLPSKLTSSSEPPNITAGPAYGKFISIPQSIRQSKRENDGVATILDGGTLGIVSRNSVLVARPCNASDLIEAAASSQKPGQHYSLSNNPTVSAAQNSTGISVKEHISFDGSPVALAKDVKVGLNSDLNGHASFGTSAPTISFVTPTSTTSLGTSISTSLEPSLTVKVSRTSSTNIIGSPISAATHHRMLSRERAEPPPRPISGGERPPPSLPHSTSLANKPIITRIIHRQPTRTNSFVEGHGSPVVSDQQQQLASKIMTRGREMVGPSKLTQKPPVRDNRDCLVNCQRIGEGRRRDAVIASLSQPQTPLTTRGTTSAVIISGEPRQQSSVATKKSHDNNSCHGPLDAAVSGEDESVAVGVNPRQKKLVSSSCNDYKTVTVVPRISHQRNRKKDLTEKDNLSKAGVQTAAEAEDIDVISEPSVTLLLPIEKQSSPAAQLSTVTPPIHAETSLHSNWKRRLKSSTISLSEELHGAAVSPPGFSHTIVAPKSASKPQTAEKVQAIHRRSSSSGTEPVRIDPFADESDKTDQNAEAASIDVTAYPTHVHSIARQNVSKEATSSCLSCDDVSPSDGGETNRQAVEQFPPTTCPTSKSSINIKGIPVSHQAGATGQHPVTVFRSGVNGTAPRTFTRRDSPRVRIKSFATRRQERLKSTSIQVSNGVSSQRSGAPVLLSDVRTKTTDEIPKKGKSARHHVSLKTRHCPSLSKGAKSQEHKIGICRVHTEVSTQVGKVAGKQKYRQSDSSSQASPTIPGRTKRGKGHEKQIGADKGPPIMTAEQEGQSSSTKPLSLEPVARPSGHVLEQSSPDGVKKAKKPVLSRGSPDKTVIKEAKRPEEKLRSGRSEQAGLNPSTGIVDETKSCSAVPLAAASRVAVPYPESKTKDVPLCQNRSNVSTPDYTASPPSSIVIDSVNAGDVPIPYLRRESSPGAEQDQEGSLEAELDAGRVDGMAAASSSIPVALVSTRTMTAFPSRSVFMLGKEESAVHFNASPVYPPSVRQEKRHVDLIASLEKVAACCLSSPPMAKGSVISDSQTGCSRSDGQSASAIRSKNQLLANDSSAVLNCTKSQLIRPSSSFTASGIVTPTPSDTSSCNRTIPVPADNFLCVGSSSLLPHRHQARSSWGDAQRRSVSEAVEKLQQNPLASVQILQAVPQPKHACEINIFKNNSRSGSTTRGAFITGRFEAGNADSGTTAVVTGQFYQGNDHRNNSLEPKQLPSPLTGCNDSRLLGLPKKVESSIIMKSARGNRRRLERHVVHFSDISDDSEIPLQAADQTVQLGIFESQTTSIWSSWADEVPNREVIHISNNNNNTQRMPQADISHVAKSVVERCPVLQTLPDVVPKSLPASSLSQQSASSSSSMSYTFVPQSFSPLSHSLISTDSDLLRRAREGHHDATVTSARKVLVQTNPLVLPASPNVQTKLTGGDTFPSAPHSHHFPSAMELNSAGNKAIQNEHLPTPTQQRVLNNSDNNDSYFPYLSVPSTTNHAPYLRSTAVSPTFTELEAADFPNEEELKTLVALVSLQGSKPRSDRAKVQHQNQDRAFIQPLSATVTAFAVFDGHGEFGHDVAQFVSDRFRSLLIEEFRASPRPAALQSEKSLLAWMKWLFRTVDKKLLKRHANALLNLRYSGSTGSVALRVDNVVYVGYIGDSKVVGYFFNGSLPVRMMETPEHNPVCENEQTRIRLKGGRVSEVFFHHLNKSVSRIVEAGISVSRAFGDLVARQFGLISDPEFVRFDICPQPERLNRMFYPMILLLASDGLWDTLIPQEVLHYFSNERSSKDALVTSLKAMAHSSWQKRLIAEGRSDDTTAILALIA